MMSGQKEQISAQRNFGDITNPKLESKQTFGVVSRDIEEPSRAFQNNDDHPLEALALLTDTVVPSGF